MVSNNSQRQQEEETNQEFWQFFGKLVTAIFDTVHKGKQLCTGWAKLLSRVVVRLFLLFNRVCHKHCNLSLILSEAVLTLDVVFATFRRGGAQLALFPL